MEIVEQAPSWDMWVDFSRVYDGLTYGHVDDTASGVDVIPDRYLIVGDYDADPGVAEVVEVKANGTVLLRVLPGPASAHLELVGHRPA